MELVPLGDYISKAMITYPVISLSLYKGLIYKCFFGIVTGTDKCKVMIHPQLYYTQEMTLLSMQDARNRFNYPSIVFTTLCCTGIIVYKLQVTTFTFYKSFTKC